MILVAMTAEVTRFERLREEYKSCPDFEEIYFMFLGGPTREMDGFLLHNGYLFKFHKLYIPHTSLRDFSLLEIVC